MKTKTRKNTPVVETENTVIESAETVIVETETETEQLKTEQKQDVTPGNDSQETGGNSQEQETEPGSKKDVASAMDVENGTLTLLFGDGRKLVIVAGELAPNIAKIAVLHGMKQKLVDAGALSVSAGKSATVSEKYDAIREVYDRLTGPEPAWNKTRTTGPRRKPDVDYLLPALQEKYPAKTEAELAKYLEGKTAKQKLALTLHADVAPIIAKLRAAEGDVDISEDLLAELD